jgi:hypothetical protein
MAIKSKGRARGRRAVAAAPRRPLVVRKPPFWRRPWLWIVLGLLAAGGIAFAVLSIMHSHDVSGRKERETLAMRTFLLQFQAGLPADRQAVPPDVVVIFPTVNDDLPKIGNDIKGAEAKQRGKEISEQAQASVTKLQAIDVDKIFFQFVADRDEVNDGVFMVSRGIGLYQQVGAIVEAAEALPKAEQKALIDQATTLTQQAGSLFDRGYAKILHILNRLGIPPNIAASVPAAPQAPSPSVTPSESASPSGAPSESPSVTPTGSASPSP